MTGIPYPCRGLFVIDPEKIVRLMSFHPWSVGRSTNELLRTLDSLQLTRDFENKVCTPADWEMNMIPMIDSNVSNDDINRLFRTGVVTYLLPSGKNYMRTVGKINALDDNKSLSKVKEPLKAAPEQNTEQNVGKSFRDENAPTVGKKVKPKKVTKSLSKKVHVN